MGKHPLVEASGAHSFCWKSGAHVVLCADEQFDIMKESIDRFIREIPLG